MLKRPIVLMAILSVFVFMSTTFSTTAEASSDVPDLRKSYEKEKQGYQKSSNNIDLGEIERRSILVKSENTSPEQLIHKYNLIELEISDVLKERGYTLLQVPESKDYETVLYKLQQEEELSSAEPNYLRQSTATPQDPYFKEQWQYEKLNMDNVWSTDNDENPVIAVLDTGVNGNHPDLKGKVLPGYNFLENDTDASDDHGHGTHIAGLIAANADDQGIVGVNPQAKILPLKVAGTDGKVSYTASLDAIYHAIEEDVDVINMSYSSYQKMDSEEEALWEAYEKGIVLVAAASNDSLSEPAYPASYRPVISVSATDEEDQLTSFSNYGNWIDLAAPGQNLVSTQLEGGYASGDGTSFSAPLVSGLASMMKIKNPDWSPSEIEWALEDKASTFTGVNWNENEGYGIPHAEQALNSVAYDGSEDIADDSGEAYLLEDTQKVTNRIGTPSDTDWYTFQASEGEEVNLSLDGVDQHMDLVAVLTDENGERTVIDNHAKGEAETYQFNATEGTYHLQVFEYYNHWSAQPYELTIEMIDSDYAPAKNEKFPDVTGTWAEDYIDYLVDQELMVGLNDGTFGFEKSISRASASVMIAKEMDLELRENHFSDVSSDHWAAGYIGAMEEAGILHGYGDGTFHPDAPLSRQEMANVIAGAYDLSGEGNSQFTDVPETSWAYEPISALVSNDVISGFPDGTFQPHAEIKRAEFATIMARLLNDEF